MTGFYWVLLGFTGFYWVLLGFTGFHLVLLGFTGLYWVLLGFTGFYWVFGFGSSSFFLRGEVRAEAERAAGAQGAGPLPGGDPLALPGGGWRRVLEKPDFFLEKK